MFDLLHVFGGFQLLREDVSVGQNLPNVLVVLDVFARYARLVTHVLLLDLQVGNLVGEVLGLDGDGR